MARPRAPTRKDQRDRQPPPEQQCQKGGDHAGVEQLKYFANCCSNSCAEQSHKENVYKMQLSRNN